MNKTRITICVDVPDGDDAEAVWVAVATLLHDGIAELDPDVQKRIGNRDVSIDSIKD